MSRRSAGGRQCACVRRSSLAGLAALYGRLFLLSTMKLSHETPARRWAVLVPAWLVLGALIFGHAFGLIIGLLLGVVFGLLVQLCSFTGRGKQNNSILTAKIPNVAD